MKDGALAALADGPATRSVDRRTLLLGAAGALAAAGPHAEPVRGAGYAGSVAARHHRRFDPVLARQLQQVLRGAHGDPTTHFPGAILHVDSPTLGAWTGVVRLGRIAPATPIRLLGMKNQYSRGSSLIHWVRHDAEFIVEQLRNTHATRLDATHQPHGGGSRATGDRR